MRRLINALQTLRYLIEAQPSSLLTEHEKRQHIIFWAKTTGYPIFVETGTYLGLTTLEMAKHFERCFTIEYDMALYNRAQSAFAGTPNITAYQGDSGELIPTILSQISKPAIFWLDAHYSGGVTGSASQQTPILRELQMIFAHPIKDHVILIDDARYFKGVDDYPRLRTVRRLAEKFGYSFRLRDDIIRIYKDTI